MNFLAHLYLSGENEETILGNFIADHVKGKRINRYSPGIIAGIKLHREIDAFTDSHPAFLSSKSRLQKKYRKYSGVIVDMFYDHFLSANWRDYSDEDITAFTNRMYKIAMKRYLILPPKTKRLLPFMAKSNWLVGYGTFEGIDRALKGMSGRTPFNSGMENATIDLKKDYDKYKGEFQEFFPEIIRFSEARREDLGI
jgi:acyl carrier protein phosphodiesterase